MTAEKKAEKPQGSPLAGGKDAGWWLTELRRSGKEWKTYRDRAKKVVQRYRDDRDGADENGVKRFAILYSNTETLGPAVYSQVPVPDIRRRWQDKDAVGRVAATVLQRATQYCVESYDFGAVLDACKMDYLLPGFAVARAKYTPYFKKSPKTGEDGKPVLDDKQQPAFDESLVWSEVGTEYVPWDCFRMSRAKTYERVWWVAFGDDLTRDEAKAQFGEEIAGKLPYGRKQQEEGETSEEIEQTARVWEVWCKRGRGRFVIAEGISEWVKPPEEDPLRLERFFPNGRPLWSISTNETLIPVPEYLEYQDQALELDDLTDRIDVLTSAMRRRGVYNAQYKDLLSMLTGKSDNQFVGIEDWASFVDKGGLEAAALEAPLDKLAAAIIQLEDRRERVKQIIYEVTGIADIVRGSSDPSETATAQSIKGKWAGLRISTRQRKFAEFARDLVRLKAEIIAERFDAQTLSVMTGINIPFAEQKQAWQQMQAAQQQQAQMQAQQAQAQGQQPPQAPQPDPEEAKFYSQPTWEEVIQVLRSDKLRGFKIDIETDSTVQPNADEEKAARTELVAAIGDASQRLAAGVQAGIISQEFAKELFAFTMRAFKAGPAVDEALDALGPSDGMSPAQQQKEQELQQREQAVAQAEQKAKDVQHQAQLATKDAQKAAQDVQHREDIASLKEKMQQDVQRIQDDFNKALEQFMGHAEKTVRETLQNAPQGVVQ